LLPVIAADAEAAMDWMDANQLGRRNLSPDQLSWLRGRRYSRTKKDHGGAREASVQIAHLKTAEALAKEPAEVADQLSWLLGRRYSRTKLTMAQAGAIKGKALCNLHKAHTAEALAKEPAEVADQLSWLLGRRYSRTKKAQGGREGRQFGVSKLDTPKTAERLAKEHGVTERTIRRAGKGLDGCNPAWKAQP